VERATVCIEMQPCGYQFRYQRLRPLPGGTDVSAPHTAYCLGFLFTEERDAVVLIKKARPAWQKGKFNGIGGHVEDGESASLAMQREANEEAGVPFAVKWELFAVMRGADWTCHCFRAFDTTAAEEANSDAGADEQIAYAMLSRLDAMPLLPNLRWLIPLALDSEVSGGNVYYAPKPAPSVSA
jgi:8-oxo-dGTP diphosphatase